MEEWLAWTGAALSSMLTLPQAVRAVRQEQLDGVAPITYRVTLGNAVVWAVSSGNHATGVPSLLNGPAAVVVLVRLGRTRCARRAGAPSPGP